MQNTQKFLLLVIFLLYSSTSLSVEVKDLYLVKWPVGEQSKSTRGKAALAGFKEVLVRKSGSLAILQSQEVKLAYRKVTSYLQKFNYVRQQDKASEYPYTISLHFEPRLIDSLIQQARMPIWGANRPVTILWIAVEENFQRHILKDAALEQMTPTDDQQQPNLVQSIKDNAVRRGLPVISPLMDLEDELVVSISDIWGRFPSTVLQASQRYSADSVLLGRIKKDGPNWLGEFTYLNQQEQSSFQVSAEQKEQVLAKMTDNLAELLCNKYCVVEDLGQKNELLMKVSGIGNFNKFKSVEKYLSSLSAIKNVDAIEIDKHTVMFQLVLFGQVESLIEGIALSQQLKVDDAMLSNIRRAVENASALDSQETEVEDSSLIESNSLNSDNGIQEEIKDTLQTLYYRWLG